MIRQLDEFGLAWVEEPVIPDDLDSYRRIRAAVGVPISGGEHEFTLQGFHLLLEQGAVDIIQPDVNRMGGITEARKIWALAQAHGVPVIPHSNQSHNAHLIISSYASPLIEYFPYDRVRTGYNLFYEFFEGTPQARGGWVEVGTDPGLGITLNVNAIERYGVMGIVLTARGKQHCSREVLSVVLSETVPVADGAACIKE
jgi:L-alanine-DL-glutamate epimerase-like enolase superfamily enzyme